MKNVSILVAIGVNGDGYCEVLSITEGTKEEKASWQAFLRYLKECGLKGALLLLGYKCLGLVESLAEFYPAAAYRRCVVHLYCNGCSLVPATTLRPVAALLEAIYASEDRESARVNRVLKNPARV